MACVLQFTACDFRDVFVILTCKSNLCLPVNYPAKTHDPKPGYIPFRRNSGRSQIKKIHPAVAGFNLAHLWQKVCIQMKNFKK
jgi:hypothetical protein